MHPEIALEDDIEALLREHEELARLLSDDAEAGRCEMGARLFEELASLRDLNERHELEKAKRALEESGRQKDLLIKEVDHRIKTAYRSYRAFCICKHEQQVRQLSSSGARLPVSRPWLPFIDKSTNLMTLEQLS